MAIPGRSLLAGALAALVIGACGDGPTAVSAAFLSLSPDSSIIKAGDSVLIEVVARAADSRALAATSATWTTADPDIATVRPVTGQEPSDTGRAWITAQAPAGGATWVRVAALGMTDSVRVVSRPRRMPTGLVRVTGTPRADTVLGVAYTAGDTVVVTAGPTLRFDSAATAVRFRGSAGYVLERGPTRFRVLSRGPYRGRVTVTNLRLAADTAVRLDTLATADTFEVARARFRGSVTVGASALGAGTLMTLDAPPGMTFSTSGTVTTVTLGATSAIVLGRNASQITAVAFSTFTGNPRINNALVGGVRVDSLYTPAPVALAAASFPGTVTGSGILSDTITVSAGPVQFQSFSVAIVNGQTAFVISRSSSTMTVVAKLGGSAAVTVTNVIVGSVTIPQLITSAPFAVATTGAGEAYEPANDAPGGATVTLGTAASPLVLFGSVDDAQDTVDLWTFTLAAPADVSLNLQFTGGGWGGIGSPDLDLRVCDATCATFVGGSGGVTLTQPETLTLAGLPAGTYAIRVRATDTDHTTYTYRLSAYAQ